MVGARESHRFAAEAVRRGAADYFALPGDLDLLRRTLEARVQSTRERVRRFEEVRQPADPFREVIGTNPAFTAALDKARRILSRGDVTVLLTGETVPARRSSPARCTTGAPGRSAPSSRATAQEMDLVPPLVIVDQATSTNLTIMVELADWFRALDGKLVNPSTGI